ncbi:FAD dependent oxidoreductase [Sulfurimonas gotlandica GD1]|jgi:tRNA 5-methylaminomethyl-2-thiouridine biosynthesis bifunctional protein|uniref:FAD dependent oxidoreductase n=1 Tax=Sulfurimonas gotlandica (strain DSM 19862 / JCM 16533 / GD1) TaxID=929558 RepID=B6BIW5_SULGG|nr:FAD-dependent oxidoreductase [Sulfurimonas gotlandica]EDZ63037.1 FAD dependent oxidoreductase [Sulfurimonas gotlandica GD1]EHP30475.1 FAD dependent oxidoreductase [Sulfurimonas gotlandica GD1]
MYDFIIVGAGSAGCSIAHFLQRSGKRVAIVDREGIAGGASGVAGAFLSPLPGGKNSYNTFVNEALNFSMNFYEELTPDFINKKGVLRVANDNFSKEKLENNEIDYNYFNAEKLQKMSNDFQGIDGYFYKDAAVIEPLSICNKMVEGCDFYKKDLQELVYKNSFYEIDDIKAKNIILTQGVSKSLAYLPYINISAIFGLRIDVKTTTNIPFNIHKSISISTNKNDGTVAIGATHERHNSSQIECITTCDKCIFYVNTDKQQIDSLLTKANELINLENLEVVKTYKGARATISSYFPVVGKIVDYESSLKKYPSIKNGTKISQDSLVYYPNLYMINALGSRGFVFGPYLAKILSEYIINETPIPKEISTQKLFYKAARKEKSQL